VPRIQPNSRYSENENNALLNLRLALDEALGVFGPFQSTAMLQKYVETNTPLTTYYPLRCNDGALVSVQSGDNAYTRKNDAQNVFTHVEVKDFSIPDDEPVCISAHDLMALLESHGGVVDGHLPALDFGRSPNRGAREDDEDVADYESRKARLDVRVSRSNA
tara:strand:- start:248 stop:733 length:486 start_codon:yes stop_codon:yes gene_type:complete